MTRSGRAGVTRTSGATICPLSDVVGIICEVPDTHFKMIQNTIMYPSIAPVVVWYTFLPQRFKFRKVRRVSIDAVIVKLNTAMESIDGVVPCVGKT